MKVGILGTGIVGQTLGRGLKGLGYDVQIGSRTTHSVDNWDGPVGTFAQVADWAELVILALKGSAAEVVVSQVKAKIAGKTVIDTTNPLADLPPEDGVVKYFTGPNESLMEHLQAATPEAHFVKAFNSVGTAVMVNPKYEAGKPTMFICGNNQQAKAEVTDILTKLGWETEDLGGVKSARAIEPLCILWCIPGFMHNSWAHAFKLLSPS